MKKPEDQDGSLTIVALSLLVIMTAAAAGSAFLLEAAFTGARRSAERGQLRSALRAEGERVAALIPSDPTPNADSPLDPVWIGISRGRTTGVTVSLQDISSRLNANWARKSLFQETGLRALLRPGITAQALQQRREDKGFSTDIVTEYGDLVKENALTRYFTGYGYANLNTTDEFALRMLYALRSGDPAGAEAFRTRWQQAIIQRKVLKQADLRGFLGADYGTMFPLMNVQPILNVHFIEPFLLSELLSCPEFSIPHPKRATQLILDSRDRIELTDSDLRRMTEAGEDNGIYQYLGVVTWFWRITVSKANARLELVVARLPSDDGSASRFQVIEERYVP